MSFKFNTENIEKAKEIIAQYPEGRQASAVLPLLDLAQRQNDGWISREVMDYIAQYLSIAPIRVYEVGSFYTMFNLKPVGKHHIQICTTTPCWLRGSDDIVSCCKQKLGIEMGETTEDKLFTISEVECLGGCSNAPLVQINDDYYEDLSYEAMDLIIDNLKTGNKNPTGSQIGRKSSEPMENKNIGNKSKK